MQYTMKVFEYEGEDEFRVIDRDGEPWFVLTEVASRLGIKNASDIAARLDADEKKVTFLDTPSGKKRLRIINESGLYSAILRSEKPEAKRFKKWVTSEVLPSIRKTGTYGRIPAFIKRYNENWDRIDPGYFSVISELVTRLWGRLEMVGHTMADRAPDGKQLRPDTSVGLLFAKWLEENHPHLCNDQQYYKHKTDEWEGDARQYPWKILPYFYEFVDEIWIPEHAERYFNKRDPAALPYLPKLLPAPIAA